MTEEQVLEERDRLIKQENAHLEDQKDFHIKKMQEQEDLLLRDARLFDDKRGFFEGYKRYEEDQNMIKASDKVSDYIKTVADLQFSYFKGEITIEQCERVGVLSFIAAASFLNNLDYPRIDNDLRAVRGEFDKFIESEKGKEKGRE